MINNTLAPHDKPVAHYIELDKTYPPERFFRPGEVGCVPRTTSPAETLDLEQQILTQLHLLSPEQQSNVLDFVERLQGQTALIKGTNQESKAKL